jgi:hydrogenase/urease accessory protein HupE
MNDMAGLIYGMCALTALLCAWLLLQAWRRSRYKLLFWSALCFVGLTVNNILLVVDKLIFPAVDMSIWRLVTGLAPLMVLLYGLIWDAE